MTRAVAKIVLCVWLTVGLFGPVLATDLPLAVRIDGAWQFPAFAALVDDAPRPPSGNTWAAWWRELPADTDDYVLLAPIPFDPTDSDDSRLYEGPTWEHPFGVDRSGRDVLSLVVHGASSAAWVALIVVLLSGLIGVVAGSLAGLCGGIVDAVVLRLIELALCFPVLIAGMCVGAFVGGSQAVVIVVLVSVYWTSFARIVRGEFLSLREREFVHTARELGVGTPALLIRHMLPCVYGSIGVVAAFVAANAIAVESTLRFLGVGSSDTVSWGMIIAQFRMTTAHAWHIWFFPSAALITAVLALHSLVPGTVSPRSRLR